MESLAVLDDVSLVPVIELEPGRFSTQERPLPAGSSHELPGEWDRYWRESLADTGVAGLTPLRPGSWRVPTRQFRDPKTLGMVLAAVVESWGGVESLTGPDTDSISACFFGEASSRSPAFPRAGRRILRAASRHFARDSSLRLKGDSARDDIREERSQKLQTAPLNPQLLPFVIPKNQDYISYHLYL